MTTSNSSESTKKRMLILVLLSLMLLGAAGIYSVQAFLSYRERTSGGSVSTVSTTAIAGDRIIFRNTAMGDGYGALATVSLKDPSGARSISSIACDRVDQNNGLISCMRTLRGIPTTFEDQVLDTDGTVQATFSLPGIPNRTRVSDGGLVATTSFITGHSYAAGSFSTETTVRNTRGEDFGNLENFAMTVDGKEMTATDRNVWGVSFISEDSFFATAASSGETWLMKGSLSHRSMESVRNNAECPSVSPDGTKVAYKKRTGNGPTVHWDIAVLDLQSGRETVIALAQGFDDQLEWLDNQRLLIGVPRSGAVGDSDVYVIDAQADAEPQMFIEHAWSPSVVRSN